MNCLRLSYALWHIPWFKINMFIRYFTLLGMSYAFLGALANSFIQHLHGKVLILFYHIRYSLANSVIQNLLDSFVFSTLHWLSDVYRYSLANSVNQTSHGSFSVPHFSLCGAFLCSLVPWFRINMPLSSFHIYLTV